MVAQDRRKGVLANGKVVQATANSMAERCCTTDLHLPGHHLAESPTVRITDLPKNRLWSGEPVFWRDSSRPAPPPGDLGGPPGGIPCGPSGPRIKPMGFPARPVPSPVSKNPYKNQNRSAFDDSSLTLNPVFCSFVHSHSCSGS